MKVTTLDIIKMLPFRDGFKLLMLEKFETLGPDQKFELEQVLWDTYEALYKLKLEENLQQAFSRAKINKEKLDSDFYARAKQQTEKEMETDFLKSTVGFDISHIRTKLELITKNESASSK